jgi:hypothetical protein
VIEGAPLIMDGAQFRLDSEQGWGAIGFIHLQHQDEHRLAFGGQKMVTYEVALMMLFQMVVRPDFDLYASPAAYQDPLDTLLDGAVTLLRSSHTLGTSPGPNGVGGITVVPSGTLFQAGEGDLEGQSTDIIIDSDLPRRDVGKVWSWHAIMFRVVEAVLNQ